MLYISSQLGRDKWLVMDTDDGVEEPVTYNDLMDCVRRGLDIKGVIKHTSTTSSWYTIHVYSEATRQGAKLSTLYGLKIEERDGVLKSFSIQEGSTRNCAIRLSDYFTEIDSYAFKGCYSKEGVRVVVILDDNIVINSKAFLNFSTMSTILFDVSDISDNKLAMKLYKAVLPDRNMMRFEDYYSRITDSNSVRWEQNIALHLLSTAQPGQFGRPTKLRALELFHHNSEVLTFIDKILGKEFKALSLNDTFYWSDNAGKFYTRDKNITQQQRYIADAKNRLHFDCRNMDTRNSNFLLTDNVSESVLGTIGYLTTVNSKSTKRLSNYLYFWKVDGNSLYRDYYLKLARNFLDWLCREEDNALR